MRTIDEIFKTPPQTTLYHYTGIGSFMGIVDSESLWASHIYYLNDSAEITYARDVIHFEIVSKLEGAVGLEKEFLEQFTKWLKSFSSTPYHLYIFSLSEEGNLLSQWRSYTPHGKGVSIGFEPKALSRKIQSQNLKIVKCIYDKAEQEGLMRDLLERMLITFRRDNPAADETQAHPAPNLNVFMEKYREEILQVFAVIKNPAFKEEKEWRIISPYFPKYTMPNIKYREGASMIVPYIEIDLSGINNDGTLFKNVYLGPSQHINLSHSALSNYMSNKNVCKETSSSAIPYREW